MDIIGGITAATEGLKLVNELRKIDHEVDKADLKLKLVELADKLVDAKSALHDAVERERELNRRIEELKVVLNRKANLMDEDGLLFELDADREKIGSPYCNHCFVKEEKLYRLVGSPWNGGVRFDCSNCKFVQFPENRRSR